MIILAFFYLLQPSEYTDSPSSDTMPFCLCNVQLFVGHHHLDLTTASKATIATATFATLEFTTQKNGVHGEVIGLACSGDPFVCPVATLVHCILHACTHGIPLDVPLVHYHINGHCHSVLPSDITDALRLAVQTIGPSLGFLETDITTHSLCAAGAMALLCAHVDSDTIHLLGHWQSDEMLWYLHVQAEPVMHDFSCYMLQHGTFTLLPGSAVPCL